jgi:hypothetical protein
LQLASLLQSITTVGEQIDTESIADANDEGCDEPDIDSADSSTGFGWRRVLCGRTARGHLARRFDPTHYRVHGGHWAALTVPVFEVVPDVTLDARLVEPHPPASSE